MKKESAVPKKVIVNLENDRVERVAYEGDRVRIMREASINYLEQYQTWNLEHFYKGHADEIRRLMKELSTNEKAFLFAIAAYVGYDDCCLKFPNGTDITSKHLIEITGLSNGAVHNTINSLVKKDIIYKGKNSKNRQYFINPWLFCKGNRINKVLKTMFKNYNIRIYGGTKWKDLKE